MPDMEKVAKGLEYCSIGACAGKECPYYHDVMKDAITGCDCTTELVRDALALLKEQEPVKPIWINTNYEQSCKCGNCGGLVNTHFKYCPRCGRLVKWE